MSGALSSVAAGFGLGIALAGAPGPVQAIILSETIGGGMSRGVRVQAGANVTFAVLLWAVALGLSVAAPSGGALRALKLAGGLFLLLVALDALRSQNAEAAPAGVRRGLLPEVRGTLAVLLNPGAWLFLATAASSLFASAVHADGRPAALAAALALSGGLMLGDGAVVLLGGVGMRRAGMRTALWIRRALALILAGLGVWLVITGFIA